MKLLFKIAKNEFRHLFYSPIAWFLLIVFLVQSAIFYTIPVLNGALLQDMASKNGNTLKGALNQESLTYHLFLRGGLFTYAIGNLYLFVPLLTMGLISREANNGTIKLLYSSPVQLRQIVFGKYLGIMLFNLLLIGIVAIFMIVSAFQIVHVDDGLLLSAALGFYLIVCTYSAIGLFMSSLSNYQIVSALASFVIIFILGRIGTLWQKYDLVRDLTYFLSLQNRTGKMLSGLITSKDVIYFISVSCMFIGFTMIRLRNAREDKPWLLKAGRYALVFVATLMLGYISSRPRFIAYWDTTATQANTIHPRTQQLLKEFGDSTLEVTLYANLLDQNIHPGLPENRNASYMARFWEMYLRFRPDITFKYEYYYNTADSMVFKTMQGKNIHQIAAEYAESMDLDISMFKKPEEMNRLIDLRPEDYRLIMKLKYKGRTELVRTYLDGTIWPDEQNMNAAFKHLLNAEVPKVLFVTGGLERNIFKTGEREYAAHTSLKLSRPALVNVGFNVDTINLATQDIPAGISSLVLADPKMDLPPVVMTRLRNYVNSGGNMLITGEPGKQYVLNPFLRELGVQLMDGQLVYPTYNETPDKVISVHTNATAGLAEETAMTGMRMAKEKGIKSDPVTTMTPGVAAVSYAKDSLFKVTPLALTDSGRTWLKMSGLVIDSTLPPMNPQEGDIKLPSFSTIVALTRNINGKEQRIAVCGDADFMSNLRYSAGPLRNALYSWMDDNRYPVYTPRRLPLDIKLTINAETAGIQKTFFIWIFPGLILVSGIVVLIRRKRK